ncbi:aminoglycoside phosphotransferase family protein [Castellaniella hirudinis]|uniref:aminoglycoside phosphotransferase family protein n=1 Tax=Castellaniella hirudinis TaxID=1144617 RepID=UPI0039C24671
MTPSIDSDPRLKALHLWLGQQDPALGLRIDSLAPVSGDASFRRYFRLQASHGPVVVMDAPPPHEDCTPFIQVAARLAAGGLRVPGILAQDLSQGFLLLTDLGRQTFYQAIQAGATQDDATWQQHMRGALRALVRLQHCNTDDLPVYDASRLLQELSLFPQWYLQAHLGHTPDADAQALLTRIFGLLAGQAAAQPQVFVHRDYHSPNLMIGPGAPDFTPGIIDFQDAVLGPISYDIASLVMDARTPWEESQQLDWAIRYWEYARTAGLPVPTDFSEFHTQYEWMGLQRNLRILGVFARLALRDAKPHYLDHIPRVRAYIDQVAGRYHALHPLLRLLEQAEGTVKQDGYSF